MTHEPECHMSLFDDDRGDLHCACIQIRSAYERGRKEERHDASVRVKEFLSTQSALHISFSGLIAAARGESDIYDKQ